MDVVPKITPQSGGSRSSATVSIADLFEIVKSKDLANEVLSKDVADEIGVSRSNGVLSKGLLYALPKDSKKISTVLTSHEAQKTTKKQTVRDVWEAVKISITDEQSGIVKAFKELGMNDAEANASVQTVRACYNAANAMLDEDQYIGDRRVGKGLNAIFGQVLSEGEEYTGDFYSYLLMFHMEFFFLQSNLLFLRHSRPPRFREFDSYCDTASAMALFYVLFHFTMNLLEKIRKKAEKELHFCVKRNIIKKNMVMSAMRRMCPCATN